MTDPGQLRDYFAGQVLASLATWPPPSAARHAYVLADAMMDERTKPATGMSFTVTVDVDALVKMAPDAAPPTREQVRYSLAEALQGLEGFATVSS